MDNPQPDKFTKLYNELKNGYFTKHPNVLFEAISFYTFSGTQRSILDVIIRRTFGYTDVIFAAISYLMFEQQTGIDRREARRLIFQLTELKVIIVKRQTGKKSNLYCINPDLSEWLIPLRNEGLQPPIIGGLQPPIIGGLQPPNNTINQGATTPQSSGGYNPPIIRGLQPPDNKIIGGLQPPYVGGYNPPITPTQPNPDADFQPPKERSKEKDLKEIEKENLKKGGDQAIKDIKNMNAIGEILNEKIKDLPIPKQTEAEPKPIPTQNSPQNFELVRAEIEKTIGPIGSLKLAKKQIGEVLEKGITPELIIHVMNHCATSGIIEWNYIKKTVLGKASIGIVTLQQLKDHEKKLKNLNKKIPQHLNFPTHDYDDEELEKHYFNFGDNWREEDVE